jgi:TonB family protein
MTLRDSADYVQVVSEPDSGSSFYNVKEYYLDGKPRLLGKSSAINPPKFEQLCVAYYENGRKKTIGNYKNGLLVNDEYEFFPNGKPYRVKRYPDNNKTENNIRNDFLIIANYDSLGTALVTNGNGHYKGYENDFKFKAIFEEGDVKDGKREGTWKGQSGTTNKINFTETYVDGKLISGSAIDKSGIVKTYTGSRAVQPQYPGGANAFINYLGHTVKYPKEDRERFIQGKVIIGFIVEKDGRITDVHVLKHVSPSLDNEAVRVITASTNWVPGTQFGNNVRVSYTVPINFTLGSR